MINKAETNIIETQKDVSDFSDNKQEINLLIEKYAQHLQKNLEISQEKISKTKK
jgi:hypothetical protein